MDTGEFVVKVGILGGTYPTPSCGCAFRPGLLMVDPDAKCEFEGDAIVAALSANIEG